MSKHGQVLYACMLLASLISFPVLGVCEHLSHTSKLYFNQYQVQNEKLKKWCAPDEVIHMAAVGVGIWLRKPGVAVAISSYLPYDTALGHLTDLPEDKEANHKYHCRHNT